MLESDLPGKGFIVRVRLDDLVAGGAEGWQSNRRILDEFMSDSCSLPLVISKYFLVGMASGLYLVLGVRVKKKKKTSKKTKQNKSPSASHVGSPNQFPVLVLGWSVGVQVQPFFPVPLRPLEVHALKEPLTNGVG